MILSFGLFRFVLIPHRESWPEENRITVVDADEPFKFEALEGGK